MRPRHEPSEVLDLPGGRSHRFVNPERFSAALRSTWTWQGTEAFLGLRTARGRVSVPTKGHSPSALIQKGDWCGSATRPPPSERKPTVRSRTRQRASRQNIGSRLRRERKKRPFDRGQLNGDTRFAEAVAPCGPTGSMARRRTQGESGHKLGCRHFPSPWRPGAARYHEG